MEYMKLAIVTDDRAYGKALARSLLIGNRNFDLALYGCGDFCRQWKARGKEAIREYDLILWDGDELEKYYGGKFVWLTERRSQAAKAGPAQKEQTLTSLPEGTGRFAIFKYSPSQAMVAEIFRIYEGLTGRRPAGTRPEKVEVFAFVSWQGGSGCTTLAMALGQELVRFYRRRVLYLSLETVESTPLYIHAPAGMKNAGEYLYHLMKGGGAPFLEEYLIRDGYGTQAFAPASSSNPLSIARPEEIARLLPALMESGRFDVIVIDAGNTEGSQVREILSYADRICLVSSREEPAREMRYRAFLEYAIGAGAGGPAGPAGELHRDSGERLIRVFNRREGLPPGMEGQPAAFVREWQGTPGSLNLEGGFGKDIHQLTELCYNGIITESKVS